MRVFGSRVEAVYAEENVWLSQRMMGQLYDVSTYEPSATPAWALPPMAPIGVLKAAEGART